MLSSCSHTACALVIISQLGHIDRCQCETAALCLFRYITLYYVETNVLNSNYSPPVALVSANVLT